METFEKVSDIEIVYDGFARGVVGGLASLATFSILGVLLSTSVRVPSNAGETVFTILFVAIGIYLLFKPLPIFGMRDCVMYYTAMFSGHAAISACLLFASFFLSGAANYAIAVAMVGAGLSLGRFAKNIAKSGE